MTTHPQDYKILFYAWQYYPQFSWAVGVTTKEFAEKNPETIRKITQIHRKAVEFIYANPKESAAVYAKVWEVSQAEAEAILPKYYEWRHWNAGEFSRQGLDHVAEGLRSVGEISGPIDWSKLIDQEYLDKDQRRPL